MKKLLVTLAGVIAIQANAYTQQELAMLEEIQQLERQVLSIQNNPQKIIGEQVDFPLPKNIKMRFLLGDPNTIFMAEYLSEKDNLDGWKGTFFGQQRSLYPLPILAELSVEGIKRNCQNLRDSSIIEHFDKAGKKNEKQPITFTYFCADQTKVAPYGEGGQMTFILGEVATFKFWQSWRPQSKQEAEKRFGIDNLDRIYPMPTKLCNPKQKQVCQFKHPKPE